VNVVRTIALEKSHEEYFTQMVNRDVKQWLEQLLQMVDIPRPQAIDHFKLFTGIENGALRHLSETCVSQTLE
jgi:hypothetical protein